MSIEDIKSPLPARKVFFEDENKTEDVNEQPIVMPRVENVDQPIKTEEVKKKNKKPLILIVALAILLLLGGGIFFF